MKFAAIEYSSKTGAVWRHTADHPNYLADPQNEIDPTSFGCYVSALEGEHIPITALVKPTIIKKIVKKLTGSWPKYNISYLKQFDALLIVHQISDGHEVTILTKRIRKELPHIKVLGVPTQPYGILKEHWQQHPDWLRDFKEFMNNCHVFVTIVHSTLPVWEKMTTTRVEYMPQPYPVKFASQQQKPRAQKKKIIYVAGRTSRDNIAKGFKVAAALQRDFPDFEIHVTEVNEPDDSLDVSALQGTHYRLQPFMPWQRHLEYIAGVTLVINTDYTQTRGRVQVDCAAVGTPSIGADSDGQVDLFPDLPANRKQTVVELFTQGKRLLEDASFYNTVTQTARQRLHAYSYSKSADRIQKLVASL